MNEKQIKLVHITIVSIIAILFVIAGYKLISWGLNASEELPETVTTDTFNSEAEDFIALVTPSNLEGRTDDGVTTVVMLGDDTLSNYPGDDGIAAQVAELADATVHNVSFANSRMASKNLAFGDNHPEDAFSLYWLSLCIAAGDFDLQRNKIDATPYKDEKYEDTLALLESIDFDTVDMITILYGPHDYLDGTMITDPADFGKIDTYSGALQAACLKIREAYPHIRIIAVSPTYCLTEDGSDSDSLNTGYGFLPDYMIAAKNIAVMNNVSYLDNYYGSAIHALSYEDLLENDIHPNEEGRSIIAARIADMILVSVNAEN